MRKGAIYGFWKAEPSEFLNELGMLWRMVLGGIWWMMWNPLAWAIPAFWLSQAEVNVPIVAQNHAEAQQKALLQAKREVIYRALVEAAGSSNAVRANFPSRWEPALEATLDSIRVLESSASADGNSWKLVLEGKIRKSALQPWLEQARMSRAPAPQTLTLLYDPQDFLFKPEVQSLMLQALHRFFYPLGLRIQKLQALPPYWLQRWPGNPEQSLPALWIQDLRTQGVLWFDVASSQLSLKKETTFQLELRTYDPTQGTFRQSLASTATWNPRQPKASLEKSLQALSLSWNPLLESLRLTSQNTEKPFLMLKVSGFRTLQQQQILTEILREYPQWNRLELKALAREWGMYRGEYSGDRQELLQALQAGSTFYQVEQATWEGALWHLRIRWQEQAVPLQPLSEEESKLWWQRFHRTKEAPLWRVPHSQGINRYALPIGEAVVDTIHFRGDVRTFRVELPPSIHEFTVRIYLLGQTSLRPQVSLYDTQQHFVARYPLSESGAQFRYVWPPGESLVFLRFSDQWGAWAGETGSYLSMTYWIKIETMLP